MSRLEVQGLVAGMAIVVGWDRTLGFFGEVRRLGQPATQYDSTTTDDGTTSLAGVLHALIEAGAMAHEDVADAERWLAVSDVEGIPEQRVGLRFAAEVILHLRKAAGA